MPSASPEGFHVWCITCKHTIVNFTIMTSLRLPGTAASQNISGTPRQWWDTDFLSFAGINILTNQYQKVTFFPLLGVRDWDWKEIVEKVKQATFSCLENEEWKNRKGVEEVEHTEKVSCGQGTRNFKTWKLKTIAATTCSRRWRRGKILSNKGGLCRGREWPVSVRVTFPRRCWDFSSLRCCLGENISSLSPLLLCLHSCDQH